ncbi:sigma-70 family RNA polymerase sigma factor [bacterium]|nr:sigma-70 family RNA polymerase sigma factor [bacterium]
MIGMEKMIEKAKRDKKVMENLINFCQEKIRKFSLPYLNRCFDRYEREDLVSAANLGFLKAVKKYNRQKGNFFSYAKLWIKAEIIKAIRANLPLCVSHSYYSKFKKEKSEEKLFSVVSNSDGLLLEKKINKELTLTEVKIETSLLIKQIQEIAQEILTPRQKEAFLLYLKGNSSIEIAREVGLSRQRINQLINASVKKIKKKTKTP